MFQEFQDQLIRMQGTGIDATLAGRRPASPFFGKGELFYPMGRKPTITKTGKISKNPAGKGSADYLIETNLPNESFQPAYVRGMGLGVPTEIGSTAILKPDPILRNAANFKFYKQDWLRGYKQVDPPKTLPGSPNAITKTEKEKIKEILRKNITYPERSKPLSRELEPYLGKTTKPATRGDEPIFRSFLSSEGRAELEADDIIKYNPDGTIKKQYGGSSDYDKIPQSWKDTYDWTPNVEAEYQAFKNDPTAPSNLAGTDDMNDYNTRGMWDSLDRPADWNQALALYKDMYGEEWMPEEDGYYHGWSQNPRTGEWLKPKHHDTSWMNYMTYAFDPNAGAVVNPEGFFGEETLQSYPKKTKYPDGGGVFNKSINKKGNLKTSAEGYYAYINGVNLSNGGSPKSGWLNKYNKK